MKKLLTTAAALLLTATTFAQLAPSADKVCPALIGSAIPAITLTDLSGKTTPITDIIKDKPSIIVFYRGGWCPYCNAHLSELGKAEDEILKTGYQIIAISPDAATELNKTLDKNELHYTLLSDKGGNLAKAMGIAFEAPQKYDKMLSKYSGGANDGYLPVPSVFITDKDGNIVFEYVNPNYKTRLSSNLLLAVLKSLNQE